MASWATPLSRRRTSTASRAKAAKLHLAENWQPNNSEVRPGGNAIPAQLWVLPAQARQSWVPASIPGLPAGDWTSLVADADCGITASSDTRAFRFDPRHPEQGAKPVPLDASATSNPANLWRRIARMPASKHDISAAVLDGQLFVAGGLTAEWGFPVRSHGSTNGGNLIPQTGPGAPPRNWAGRGFSAARSPLAHGSGSSVEIFCSLMARAARPP